MRLRDRFWRGYEAFGLLRDIRDLWMFAASGALTTGMLALWARSTTWLVQQPRIVQIALALTIFFALLATVAHAYRWFITRTSRAALKRGTKRLAAARIVWHPAEKGLVFRGRTLNNEWLYNVVVVLAKLEWSSGDGRFFPATEEIPNGVLPLRLAGGSATWEPHPPVDYQFLTHEHEIAVIQLHPSAKGGISQFRICRSGTWRVHLRLTCDTGALTEAFRFRWDGQGTLLPLDA
jgi:hypothetical protein